MSKIYIANWKMQLKLAKSLALLKEFKYKLEIKRNAKVIVCPDFLSLGYIAAQIGQERIFPFHLGAQNTGQLDKGALTGDVSALNLKKIGVNYIILGHSERRQAGEVNSLIKEKILNCLNLNLYPIVCLGESKAEKKAKLTNKVIARQLKELFDFNKENKRIKNIIIAYEPLWAIGTNLACKPEDANMVFEIINNFFAKKFKVKPACLYGGSVNTGNAASFLKQENIDGLLVGGESLSLSKFNKIINSY